MDRLKELIATIFILLIIVSISSKGYKAFKRSDYYKQTNFYKKKLKSQENAIIEMHKKFGTSFVHLIVHL